MPLVASLVALTALAVSTVLSAATGGANVDVPWNVFQFVLTSAVGVYVWITQREYAQKAEIAALREAYEERTLALEHTLATLVERVAHVPQHHELRDLSERVGQVGEQMVGLRQSVDRELARLERIEDFLLRPR